MKKTMFLRSLWPMPVFALCAVLVAGDLQAQERRHTLSGTGNSQSGNSNSSANRNSNSNNNHSSSANRSSNSSNNTGNSNRNSNSNNHSGNSNNSHGNSGGSNNNSAGSNDGNINRRGFGPGMGMPPEMWGQMQNMSPEQRRAMFEQMRQQRMGQPAQQPASVSSTPGDQAAIARVYAQQESRDLNDSANLAWRKLTDEQRKTIAAMSEKKRPAFKKMLHDYIQSPDDCSSDTVEKMEGFLTPRQVDSIKKLDKEQRQQAVHVIDGFTSAALVRKFFLDLPKADKDALKKLTPSEKRDYLEQRGLTLPHEVLVSLGVVMEPEARNPGLEVAGSDMPVSSGSEISRPMPGDFKAHQPALDMDMLIDSWLDDSSSKPISSKDASTTATF